jgi:hypothetical protein
LYQRHPFLDSHPSRIVFRRDWNRQYATINIQELTMLKWFRQWQWTPDSERAKGREAAHQLLSTNPTLDTLSRSYTAAKMDEIYPLRRGPYFAEGYIEVLRPALTEQVHDQSAT